MLANILIILFLLLMILWWSQQGLFSAFLHTCVVVVAGTLAFALWEPLMHMAGMSMQPQYGWATWLLGPFALWLLVFRKTADKLIPGNLQFPRLVDMLGGGAFGLLAGALTVGITLTGLSFLPLGPAVAGYQPYGVSADGRLEVAKGPAKLWIGVDKLTVGFFNTLSEGAFATSTPLATARPNVIRQATRMRLQADENGSMIAIPGSVEIDSVLNVPVSEANVPAAVADQLGDGFRRGNNSVYVVGTTWKKTAGTYDGDDTLRVPHTHIRLAVELPLSEGGGVEMLAPVGFRGQVTPGRDKWFFPVNDSRTTAFGFDNSDQINWVFILPPDQKPLFLDVRGLRLPIPSEVSSEAGELAAQLGEPKPAEAAEEPANTGEFGEREGMNAGQEAREIVATADLPRSVSVNAAQMLEYKSGEDGPEIDYGGPDTAEAGARSGPRTTARRLSHPKHKRMLRLEIEAARAKSLLGRARMLAAEVHPVWLVDGYGDRWYPLGYVWEKKSGDQVIYVNRQADISSAKQLPIADMMTGDKLFLYFQVNPKITIKSYHVGPEMSQEVNFVVPE